MFQCRSLILSVLLFSFSYSPTATGQTLAQRQQARLLYSRPAAMEKARRLDEALKLIRQATKLDPKSDIYLAYAAKLEIATKKYKDAIEHALAAIKINSKNPYYSVFVMQAANGGKEYGLAKEYAQKVFKLGARRVGIEYWNEAKSILSKVDRNIAATLYQMAVSLHQQNQPIKALDQLKEAILLVPDNREYRKFLEELKEVAARHAFDMYARKVPPEVEKSTQTLAKYLTEPAKTERDKARMLFCWITDRINYDVESYFAGKSGPEKPAEVLAHRKALCEGFSNLFVDLAKHSGLKAVKVQGFLKKQQFKPGDKIQNNHSWNAVSIDGKWHLIDTTLGSGEFVGKDFKKVFKEFYFLPESEKLIFRHFASDPKWQLLDPPVTTEEFQRWPMVPWLLFNYGTKAKVVREKLQQKSFRGFVRTFSTLEARITIKDAPIGRHLVAGKKYRFHFETHAFSDIAAFHNGAKLAAFSKNGNEFIAELVATKGKLAIAGKTLTKATVYDAILEYLVE